MRKKVLFIVQLPPPLHGSSSINKVFVESKIINESFEIKVLPLKFAKSMEDIGAFSLLKVLKMFLFAFKLIGALITFKPNLVYFTFSPKGISFYRDVFYVLILNLFRKKILFHLHVKGITEQSEKSKLKKALYKFAFKNTYIICLSEMLVRDLKSVYRGEPYILNNGLHSLYSEPELLKKKNDKIELLYLSNLMKAKGVFVLLDALKILNEGKDDFMARIVGKPADISKKEIEEYLVKNGMMDCAIVEDGKYGEEKIKAFQTADIFVHPTLNDAFPLVILEAMQFQVPVVSTMEGSISEIVEDGVNGFLVAKNDPVGLAERIRTLMINRSLREQMGKEGRKKFLINYTSEKMELNLESIMKDVLQ